MLTSTFCHLPRFGRQSELRLWEQGVANWDSFLRADSIKGVGAKRKLFCDRQLHEARKALYRGDASFFTCLPSVEHWRLWEEFKDEACFVDIETDYRNSITVLGVSDGEHVWQFVKGINLDSQKIKEVFSRFKLFVTFNGASFDLPIIRRYFRNVIPDVPHIDLRHAGARADLTGGLKKIEKEVGIAREELVDGVSGADALALWHLYRHTGNTHYRDVLLQYNAEDVLNLKPLAKIIYSRLVEKAKKSLNREDS